jgi:hypothetical protein
VGGNPEVTCCDQAVTLVERFRRETVLVLGSSFFPEKRTARKLKIESADRPVVCLGLTKRWSLYVASTGYSGLLTDLRQAESILIHR